MDFDILLCILLSLVSLVLGYSFLLKPNSLNLPPTPLFCLPFIGHFHLIKHPVHRTFQTLSQKYGHVFSLKFGSRLVVVVSSPSAVHECFTKNDIILANRPSLNTGKYLAYDHTTMVVSPYGEHWRNLRRIATLEIFSTTRLNSFLGTREDEVKRLLRKLCGNYYKMEDEFRVVELEPMLSDLTFNIVMRMVGGIKFCEEINDNVLEDKKRYSKKFREMVTQIMAHGGGTNPGDFIPLWNWIDPTGFNKRIMKLGRTSDELLQELVDEIRNDEDEGNTMIHHLLRLQNIDPQYYSDQIIKGLIQVIFLAGIDTTAVTLEWALSNLLNNPKVLKKARDEIDTLIGQEHLVNEADLSRLSYLQQIILETLRLNPAAPLLVPHCASEHCKIGVYDVPRNTIVLINVWALHRESSLWDDAASFKPERHENANGVDSYKLLPFGLGRRVCPGMGMAQRVLSLTLASLIQCFDWERLNNSLVDMTEGEGLTMPKAQPLIVKCKPRPIMKSIMNGIVDDIGK